MFFSLQWEKIGSFLLYLISLMMVIVPFNGVKESAIAAPSPESNPDLPNPSSDETERDWEILLVGLIAGSRREIPAVLVRGKIKEPEAIQFQQWLVPYQSVIDILDFEEESVGENQVQLSSPGLVTRLNLNELSENPEIGLAFSIAQIEEKFGIEARFDINEYAIILSAPWIGQRRQAPTGFDRKQPPQLEGLPKLAPPAFTLTSVEQIATFTPEAGLGGSDGDLFAVGTFFGGSYEFEIAQPKLRQTESWQLDRFQYFRPTPKADLIAG